MFSFRRPIDRLKLIPQVSLSGLKESVLNGIAISAVHPVSCIVVAASQIESQSQLISVTFLNSPSPRIPFGVSWKT